MTKKYSPRNKQILWDQILLVLIELNKINATIIASKFLFFLSLTELATLDLCIVPLSESMQTNTEVYHTFCKYYNWRSILPYFCFILLFDNVCTFELKAYLLYIYCIYKLWRRYNSSPFGRVQCGITVRLWMCPRSLCNLNCFFVVPCVCNKFCRFWDILATRNLFKFSLQLN